MSKKDENQPILAPASRKQAMMLECDADVMVIGGSAGCVRGAAGVITQHGWKDIKDYEEGDLILQFDPKTQSCNFVKPLQYIKLPCEEMNTIYTRGVDLEYSPEHRVVYATGNKNKETGLFNLKVDSFENVCNRHVKSKTKGFSGVFLTGSPNGVSGMKGINLTDEQLRVQVAVNADGSVAQNVDGSIYTSISVSKDRKAQRLRLLLTNANIPFKEKKEMCDRYTNGYFYYFTFHAPTTKHYDARYYSCTQEQLEIIVEESMYWDGSDTSKGKGGKTQQRFFSVMKDQVDFMQYAAAMCGRGTSIHADNRERITPSGHKTTNTQYTLNIHNRLYRTTANKDGKVPLGKVKTEDGYKYCFTVPTGMFIVRINGKIQVTGNSGKSYVINMLPYLYLDDPNTRVIMIRKTRPQLTGAGGLWDTAMSIVNMLPQDEKPKVRARDLELVYPSGATVKMYPYQYEKDADNFQGLQPTLTCFDEGTQFSQPQIEYLFSRMRNNSKYKSRIVISCNPDPDSFIKMLIEWYLDEDGFPDQEKDGVIRYFTRVDGLYVWGDTKEELIERYGADCEPVSFSFISAVIYDNPPMLKNNPSYLAFLKGLPFVEKARLLFGNWLIRPEGANYFKREWLQEITSDKAPASIEWCRAWDKAASERTTEEKFPDATASIKVGKCRDGFIYLAGKYCADNYDDFAKVYGRFCETVGRRDRIIEKQAFYDGTTCTIVFPQDPAAAGKMEYLESAKRLNASGFVVKPDSTRGNKLTRVKPFFSAAENGTVYILRDTFDDATYEFIMNELESFTGERSSRQRKDDYVDAVGSGYAYHSSKNTVRTYVVPQSNNLTNLAKSLGR